MSRALTHVARTAKRRTDAHRAYVAAILHARETATLAEIAAAAGISYQAVSRLLQRNAPKEG